MKRMSSSVEWQWPLPPHASRIAAIDLHTGGEPLRVITGGVPIKRAVMGAVTIAHPFEEELGFLYGTIFTALRSSPGHTAATSACSPKALSAVSRGIQGGALARSFALRKSAVVA